MPHTPSGQTSALVWMLVCACAAVWGRTPERVGAAACWLAMIATVLVQDRVMWIDPERRLLAIDVGLFIVFACLATSTRRRWVIPAAAAQLLSVLVHFLILQKSQHLNERTFLTAIGSLSYLVILSLGWGVWQIKDESRRQAA